LRHRGLTTGALPGQHRRLGVSAEGVVVRQQLRLRRGVRREALYQRRGDAARVAGA
jgi:hypothetical protein